MSAARRDMHKADVGRVHEIECVCFRTPWSKLSLLGELKNDVAVYLVLEQEGRVVGYGGMWVVCDEAHVTNIAVLPECRRRGYARALLLALMRRALNRGATSMTLEVRETNAPAQALYRQMGFEQNGSARGTIPTRERARGCCGITILPKRLHPAGKCAKLCSW